MLCPFWISTVFPAFSLRFRCFRLLIFLRLCRLNICIACRLFIILRIRFFWIPVFFGACSICYCTRSRCIKSCICILGCKRFISTGSAVSKYFLKGKA